MEIELLSDSSALSCPSVALGTVPRDILDVAVVGIYPINDELAASLDEFLNRASAFLEDTVHSYSPFTMTRFAGSTLWMTDEESKQQRDLPIDRPLNIHESVKTNAVGHRYTVIGDYLYYHY